MRPGDAGAVESDRLEDHRHPRETARLIGHVEAEMALLEAFRANRLQHAWLIGGPEGIGKATLAWRFARFVLAHPDPASDEVAAARDLSVPNDHPATARIAAGGHGDVAVLRREWNDKNSRFFSEIRVDDVRRVSSMFQQASRAGGYRICILDSAEDLNANSANALLKLIEEPPPLSLFLIVAHRPARILPTLRSRCRLLSLSTPSPAETIEAVRALGPPYAGMEESRLAQAVERGRSVRAALHWLAGDRLAFDRETTALLDRLPELDWGALHRLADRVGGDEDDFGVVVAAVLEWLHLRVERASANGPLAVRRLAPLAEVWEKVRRSVREAEIFNLDKRTTLLSIFADLAQASHPL